MARSVDDFAPKIPSGVDAIDREWGGLYDGGSYLAYGRMSNGRGLLSLRFAQIGAALEEKTLYVSSERSKDLIIQAASIGFDIRRAHRLGVFKLVRLPQLLKPHPDRIGERFSPFERLVSQVRSYRPKRLVVADAISFAGNLDPLSGEFRTAYATFLEHIEPLGTTLMVTLPEPTNEVARRFTEFVMSRSTAAVFVGRSDDAESQQQYQLTLIPQIGHITRKRVVSWDLRSLVEKAEQVQASYLALKGRIEASAGAFLLPESEHTRPRLEITEVVEPIPQVEVPAAPTEEEHVVPHQTLDDLARDPFEVEPRPSVVGRVLENVLRNPTETFEPRPAHETHPGADVEEIETAENGRVSTPEVEVEETPPTVGRADERQRFASSLQAYFDAAGSNEAEFLAVAMRVDKRDVSDHEFALLCDGVSEALRSRHLLYTDHRRRRLVLIMPESSADQAQELFADVKARLRSNGLPGAESVLRKVSAIVVPNGNPFSSADEFLTYVLDGE